MVNTVSGVVKPYGVAKSQAAELNQEATFLWLKRRSVCFLADVVKRQNMYRIAIARQKHQLEKRVVKSEEKNSSGWGARFHFRNMQFYQIKSYQLKIWVLACSISVVLRLMARICVFFLKMPSRCLCGLVRAGCG